MLEENIIIDGIVREPLTVWGSTIVDGHHRWAILQRNPDIPFVIQRMEFPGKWAAIEWMCSNQLGRRNVTPEQKTYLIGKVYEARKHTIRNTAGVNQHNKEVCTQNGYKPKMRVSEQIAAEHKMGKNTVVRAGQYVKGLDMAESVCHGFKDKVLTREIKANQADIAELRNLPEDEVLAAVQCIERGKPPPGRRKAQNQVASKHPLQQRTTEQPSGTPNIERTRPSIPAAQQDPTSLPPGIARIEAVNRKTRDMNNPDAAITFEDVIQEFVLAREDAVSLLRTLWDRYFDQIVQCPDQFLTELSIMMEEVNTMIKECKAHEKSI